MNTKITKFLIVYDPVVDGEVIDVEQHETYIEPVPESAPGISDIPINDAYADFLAQGGSGD